MRRPRRTCNGPAVAVRRPGRIRHPGRVTSTAATPAPAPPTTSQWGLLPALGVVASAVLLFWVEIDVVGYPLLWGSVLAALLVRPALARDLGLIASGLTVVSLISLEADVSNAGILRFAIFLSLAVIVPFTLERLVFRQRGIQFPVRSKRRWEPIEKAYLAGAVVIGWLFLPVYFLGSGAYLNWPEVTDPEQMGRLFFGVNAVGIWDELFFICTIFALFRKHFPMWQANLLQAGIFISFLWELGYRSWAPLFTIPFALAQGYLFSRTRNLVYVICVHLLFDLMVFLSIVHAYNPGLLPIFPTAIPFQRE
ncbi:MAG: family intrarane metalloprotease [Naasia sp.]|nr:family intrarane metalloprotease [Naasia sp.]